MLSLLGLFCCPALTGSSVQAQDEKPRMLFVTQSKGFVHNPVRRKGPERSGAELAMMQLAKDSGEFTVVCTQNVEADFTKENLENFDIVAFYTTGKLPISPETFDYFLKEWLTQKGNGMLGFHSATDTFKDFEPYWDLIGGTFNGHPWGAGSTVTMQVHDLEHPGMKPFGSEQFEWTDEIYQYRNWQPEKVHVLMSLDMENSKLKRPYHVPVAWCKQIGEGKLFYNNMGHRDDTWTKEPFLNSIVGAVRWIAGEEKGDAIPNPEVSAAQDAASKVFAEAAGVTGVKLEAEKKAKEARAKARRAIKAKEDGKK
ncbi:MAG: ThuA domain-containing protein [Planctomycetota bacterium]